MTSHAPSGQQEFKERGDESQARPLYWTSRADLPAPGILFCQVEVPVRGHDDLSVVDASLRVYGITGLRVAEASIMPRVTTGNTQAPCTAIGEQAASAIREAHGF